MSDKKLLTREDILDSSIPEQERQLSRIARRIREKVQLSDDDLEFIEKAFSNILKGEAPSDALGLKKRNPREKHYYTVRREKERAKDSVRRYYSLVIVDGMSPARAKYIVSDEFCISKRGLEKRIENLGEDVISEIKEALNSLKIIKPDLDRVATQATQAAKLAESTKAAMSQAAKWVESAKDAISEYSRAENQATQAAKWAESAKAAMSHAAKWAESAKAEPEPKDGKPPCEN